MSQPKRWLDDHGALSQALRAYHEGTAADPNRVVRLAARLGLPSGGAAPEPGPEPEQADGADSSELAADGTRQVLQAAASNGVRGWWLVSGVALVAAAVAYLAATAPATRAPEPKRVPPAEVTGPMPTMPTDDAVAQPSMAPAVPAPEPPEPAQPTARSREPASSGRRPRQVRRAQSAAVNPGRTPNAGTRTDAAPPNPEAELALLKAAQAALDGEPSRALALAAQHKAEHPAGVFVQERELLAIEALLKLRQRKRAALRAEAFVARFPQSAHTRRLAVLLDELGRTPEPGPNDSAGSANR